VRSAAPQWQCQYHYRGLMQVASNSQHCRLPLHHQQSRARHSTTQQINTTVPLHKDHHTAHSRATTISTARHSKAQSPYVTSSNGPTCSIVSVSQESCFTQLHYGTAVDMLLIEKCNTTVRLFGKLSVNSLQHTVPSPPPLPYCTRPNPNRQTLRSPEQYHTDCTALRCTACGVYTISQIFVNLCQASPHTIATMYMPLRQDVSHHKPQTVTNH
jgi:hypothetical protein